MIESLHRIAALARKEILAVLKDRRERWSLLIPPIIQALIFGYAATYDLNHVRYAVLDQDRSFASRDLTARLDGSGIFERIDGIHHAADAQRLLNEGRALLVVQIDSHFERDLINHRTAAIQVLADGRNSNTANTAVGYINEVVASFNADWRESHGLPPPPVQAVMRAWYNPNLESSRTMIPGMIGTLTMLQTLLLTAMSVAREREEGTFDQLLVTPFRPIEIMIGKALPCMLIGAVQATAILLVAQLWFRIPFEGSFFALYAGLSLFLLAAVGIGLLVSSIAQNMQQAMLSSFFLIMPFALLSGLTTPVSNMPHWLQVITCINPLRYAIDITQRIYLEGVGLEHLLGDLWPLALISTLTLSAASWMFRNRLQ